VRAARAVAHTNIALIKYWGKRPGEPDQNLPAVGSLSLTLERLRSDTTVRAAEQDSFVLDDAADPGAATKVFRHLDRVWRSTHTGARPPCAVTSTNHLPTAAGLASSASGFAALTLAAAGAFGLDLEDRGALSALARRGSGSAARSLWGGFVRQLRGALADGSTARARPLFGAGHWDLRLLIVHTARGKKPVGSTDGMRRSADTSPYYPAWSPPRSPTSRAASRRSRPRPRGARRRHGAQLLQDARLHARHRPAADVLETAPRSPRSRRSGPPVVTASRATSPATPARTSRSCAAPTSPTAWPRASPRSRVCTPSTSSAPAPTPPSNSSHEHVPSHLSLRPPRPVLEDLSRRSSSPVPRTCPIAQLGPEAPAPGRRMPPIHPASRPRARAPLSPPRSPWSEGPALPPRPGRPPCAPVPGSPMTTRRPVSAPGRRS
jgi:hypothetical protein